MGDEIWTSLGHRYHFSEPYSSCRAHWSRWCCFNGPQAGTQRSRGGSGRWSDAHSKVPSPTGHGDADTVMELTPEVVLSEVAADSCRASAAPLHDSSSTTTAAKREGPGGRGHPCMGDRCEGRPPGDSAACASQLTPAAGPQRALPSRRVSAMRAGRASLWRFWLLTRWHHSRGASSDPRGSLHLPNWQRQGDRALDRLAGAPNEGQQRTQ